MASQGARWVRFPHGPAKAYKYLRNIEIYEYNICKPRNKAAVIDESVASALRQFKADVFQVLAHPTRIHIVESLRNGEIGVKTLLDEIGVEAANLSQHLNVLKAKRLIDKRKDGNHVSRSIAYRCLRNDAPLLSEATRKRLSDVPSGRQHSIVDETAFIA